MRRILTVLLSTAAIAVSNANALAVAPRKTIIQKFVGVSAQADRWGYVQVVITVRKTTTTVKGKPHVTRRMTDLSATYPDHTHRSIFINEQAIPILRSEALQAQSANIQLVSGATATTYAFAQSLQSAIVKALHA